MPHARIARDEEAVARGRRQEPRDGGDACTARAAAPGPGAIGALLRRGRCGRGRDRSLRATRRPEERRDPAPGRGEARAGRPAPAGRSARPDRRRWRGGRFRAPAPTRRRRCRANPRPLAATGAGAALPRRTRPRPIPATPLTPPTPAGESSRARGSPFSRRACRGARASCVPAGVPPHRRPKGAFLERFSRRRPAARDRT